MQSFINQSNEQLNREKTKIVTSINRLEHQGNSNSARTKLNSFSLIESSGLDHQREFHADGELEVARQSSAMEAGNVWDNSTAKCVAWLQPEDQLIPETVARVLDLFNKHPECDVIYGSARLINADGIELDVFHPRAPSEVLLRRRFCLLSAATFIRKSAIDRHGSLDGSWHYCAAYEYWIRLTKSGAKFQKFDSVVVNRMMTPGNPLLSLAGLDELPLACDELKALLKARFGSVSSSWAFWMGRACASSLQLNPSDSRAIDRAILEKALEAADSSSLFDSASLQLRARYGISRILAMLGQPGLAGKPLTPKDQSYWLRRRLKDFRTPKLFRLHRHAARPTKKNTPLIKSFPLLRQGVETLPRIAIVTPNFNGGQFLERTIQSIVEQGYPKLDYHVQDGGSRDSSLEIIRAYADRLSSWESVKDRGQSHAINLGFQHVEGDVMGWLNSDDILLPRTLERVGRFFSQHPDIDVVYGHRLLIDSEDRVINRWILPAHDHQLIQWADYIPQETMFWRRELWDHVGGFVNEQLQFAMDWDLILRFRRAGARFHRIPRMLAAFRISDQQKTSQLFASVGRQESNSLRRQELGFIPSDEEVARKLKSYLRRHWWADKSHSVQERLGWQESY